MFKGCLCLHPWFNILKLKMFPCRAANCFFFFSVQRDVKDRSEITFGGFWYRSTTAVGGGGVHIDSVCVCVFLVWGIKRGKHYWTEPWWDFSLMLTSVMSVVVLVTLRSFLSCDDTGIFLLLGLYTETDSCVWCSSCEATTIKWHERWTKKTLKGLKYKILNINKEIHKSTRCNGGFRTQSHFLSLGASLLGTLSFHIYS